MSFIVNKLFFIDQILNRVYPICKNFHVELSQIKFDYSFLKKNKNAFSYLKSFKSAFETAKYRISKKTTIELYVYQLRKNVCMFLNQKKLKEKYKKQGK